MRMPLAIIGLILLVPSAIAQGKFDGLWKRAPIVLPDGKVVDPYACSVGEVEGTLPIQDNTYRSPEGECTFSNARNVRGMDATLYDVTCRGDWGSRTERELFMFYRGTDDDVRLLILKPHGVAEFVPCN